MSAASAFDAPSPFASDGHPPGAPVSVQLSCEDASGVLWTGAADGAADPHGRLTLDLAPAIARLAPQDRARFHERQRAEPHHGARPAFAEGGALEIVARVERAGAPDQRRIRRFCQAGAVVEEIVRADPGIRGRLYRPDGAAPRGGVLLLAGSGGGIDAHDAAMLAGHGWAVFAQALFAFDDLPPHMVDLPVERIGRGLDWLARRVGGPVSLRGVSKGSEGACHAALAYPELVRRLILWVPSPMATTGRGAEPGPRALFTRDGAPIPFGAPPFPADFGADAGTPEAPLVLAPIFDAMWRDPAQDRFRLAVEALRAPVLLASGADDRIWPSQLAARQIAARMARDGSKPATQVENPEAGHSLTLPGVPAGAAHLSRHPRQETWLAMGGSTDGAAAGALRSWRAMVAFLDERAPEMGA
ncbi:MAG: acyl-CoA thioester hydrolase/BAAT C-terminal domain-containing protein [Pseudomonadota bacterium]